MKTKSYKCISCNKEATFIAPEYYCDFHWVKWWVDGVVPKGASKAVYDKEFKMTMRLVKKGLPPEKLDSSALAKQKQEARAKDEKDLNFGKKTPEQLRKENHLFKNKQFKIILGK